MALEPDFKKRLRSDRAEVLITDAETAATMIQDGMAVGISGFTNAGRMRSRSRLRTGVRLKLRFTPAPRWDRRLTPS